MCIPGCTLKGVVVVVKECSSHRCPEEASSVLPSGTWSNPLDQGECSPIGQGGGTAMETGCATCAWGAAGLTSTGKLYFHALITNLQRFGLKMPM